MIDRQPFVPLDTVNSKIPARLDQTLRVVCHLDLVAHHNNNNNNEAETNTVSNAMADSKHIAVASSSYYETISGTDTASSQSSDEFSPYSSEEELFVAPTVTLLPLAADFGNDQLNDVPQVIPEPPAKRKYKKRASVTVEYVLS
jgi:hypothetical protein